MDLQFAVLAANGDVGNTGSLHLFQAGIDTIESEGIPAAMSLALAFKVLASAGDDWTGHKYSIEISTPTGERLPIQKQLPIKLEPNPKYPGRLPGYQVLAKLTLVFAQFGEYRFHVVIDGKDEKTLPIHVVQQQQTEAPQ